MGGKSKRDRTKNNVRPSSSGRSAELLVSSTKEPAVFGIITGKPLTPIFPTLAAVNFEHGLSTEYSLCFKKFNKKDPITKTKALLELLEIMKHSETDDVVAALPAWAHFYPILSVDTDRKVREYTQACHAVLAARSGRQLARQLRRLLPAWLLAARDDHGPAQQHAQASLMNTFPEGKLAEAMSFCKTEISALLLENLMKNGEGMIVKKMDNEEDKKVQVSFIVASSLGALALFVSELPAPLADWLWAALLPLLQAPSFWNLIQKSNDQIHVRAAWYGLVGRVWARFGSRAGAECGRRAWRALLAAPERASAAPHRWAALLLLMRNAQDWPSWADNKDLLVKRLQEVLENGGWGDAKLLSDLLLPLLACLPHELLSKQFYSNFFNSIFIGLEKKNILSSKSERQAWIKTLSDFLRYVSIQRHDFAVEIVTHAHRTWLAKVLAVQEQQARSNLIKCTASNVAALCKFWLRRSKEENDDKYDQLLRNCWQNIGSTVATQVDGLAAEGADIARVMDDHILLLRSLRTAFDQDEKKKHSIKFAGDVEIEPEVEVTSGIEYDAAATERYKHNLNETVEKTCALYMELAAGGGASSAVLPPLFTLLVEFDCRTLLAAMAAHFEADSVYGLYERVLRGWLMNDSRRCKALVDIVFLLLKYLTEEEQDRIFESFEQLEQSALEWCLSLSVSHPYCAAPASRRWLRGAAVQRVLLALGARALCLAAPSAAAPAAPDSAAAQLLLQCAGHDAQGESITSDETVEKIVEQVCEAVSTAVHTEVESAAVERRARTAAQLCGALAAARSAHCAPLAHALFALQLHVPRGDLRLSLDTWLEARCAWQDALAALPPPAAAALLQRLVDLVHRHLFQHLGKLDIGKIENIVSVAGDVVAPSGESSGPAEYARLSALAQRLLAPCDSPPDKSLEYYALKCDCIMGYLNCPFDDNNALVKKLIEESADDRVADLDTEEVMLSAHRWLFRALYLRTVLLTGADEDAEEATQESRCDTLLKEDFFREQVTSLLYDYMVLSTLERSYAFWSGYEVLKKTHERLNHVVDDIIKETSIEMRQKLIACLSEKAASVGYYWSYARRFYELSIPQKKSETETEQDASLAASECVQAASAEDQQAVNDGTIASGERTDTNVNTDTDLDLDGLSQIVTGGGFFHTLQANSTYPNCSSDEELLRCRYLVMVRSVLAALGGVGAEGEAAAGHFAARAAAGLRDCQLDPLVDLHCTHRDILLTEREIISAPWANVVSSAAVADLLTAAVDARGWDLPSHQWDFVALTLAGLVESLYLSVRSWGCTKVALVCRSVLRLFARVQRFACGVRAECERRSPHDHLLALADEWPDVFAPAINTHLFNIILHILGESARASDAPVAQGAGAQYTVSHVIVTSELAECAASLQWALLPGSARAGALALPDLARAAADALAAAAHPAHILLAYKLLRVLAMPLVLADAALLAQWSALGEDAPRPALSPAHYDAALRHLQDLVAAALSNVSVCESCSLVAHSDGERVACAFLLLHAAVHEQARLARGDLAIHYVDLFREGKFAEQLTAASVRLLPAELAAPAPAATAARYKHLFLDTPDPTLRDLCSESAVSALACRGLWCALGGAGAAEARGWWGALGVREARAVRSLVTACVAPLLRDAHLADLRARANTLPDAEVSILCDGEARCRLQLDDRELELSVQFSEAHPLVPPRVAATATAALLGPGAADAHWLTMYLAYQNGSLYNTFKMWVRAMNARIESTRQCCVCYYRLHPSTGRLPAALCPRCRNKFHNVCLRKWFKTHGKPTCPLCRSEF